LLSIYVEYVGAEEGVEKLESAELDRAEFVGLDGLSGKFVELEELKVEADW